MLFFLLFRFSSQFFSAIFVQLIISLRKVIREGSLMAIWKAPGYTFLLETTDWKNVENSRINAPRFLMFRFRSQFFCANFAQLFISLRKGVGKFSLRALWKLGAYTFNLKNNGMKNKQKLQKWCAAVFFCFFDFQASFSAQFLYNWLIIYGKDQKKFVDGSLEGAWLYLSYEEDWTD